MVDRRRPGRSRVVVMRRQSPRDLVRPLLLASTGLGKRKPVTQGVENAGWSKNRLRLTLRDVPRACCNYISRLAVQSPHVFQKRISSVASRPLVVPRSVFVEPGHGRGASTSNVCGPLGLRPTPIECREFCDLFGCRRMTKGRQSITMSSAARSIHHLNQSLTKWDDGCSDEAVASPLRAWIFTAMNPDRCPHPHALHRLLNNELGPATEGQVVAHIETCKRCRDQFESLTTELMRDVYGPPTENENGRGGRNGESFAHAGLGRDDRLRPARGA